MIAKKAGIAKAGETLERAGENSFSAKTCSPVYHAEVSAKDEEIERL